MDRQDRKAAIAAYKERKGAAGIYRVCCTASGEAWVGRTPTLETIRNRLWFTLRQGTHPLADLQAAWTAHGAERFTFDVLERLPETITAFARDDRLKARVAHWREALGAKAV